MPHRSHFVQAFEIALFSIRSNGTHYYSQFWFCFFEIIWIVEFTRQNYRHKLVSFFPTIFYFSIRFNFIFDAQNLLLVTVAMLSLYQSPV